MSLFHAKAQNLRRALTDAYDDILGEYDAIVLPTTPMTARDVRETLSFGEKLDRAADMIGNVAPFDVTGHPAINVPCGTANGLPVGLQLVGTHFDGATVLATAAAFEETVGWD